MWSSNPLALLFLKTYGQYIFEILMWNLWGNHVVLLNKNILYQCPSFCFPPWESYGSLWFLYDFLFVLFFSNGSRHIKGKCFHGGGQEWGHITCVVCIQIFVKLKKLASLGGRKSLWKRRGQEGKILLYGFTRLESFVAFKKLRS